MSYRQQILNGEKEIRRLHERIHQTFARRDEDEQAYKEWKDACSEFHREYPRLAWIHPDGDYRNGIRDGSSEAIEYGLQFVELRPYFFRSGYMYRHLLRTLKNAKLSHAQRERFNKVMREYDEYRARRRIERGQQ